MLPCHYCDRRPGNTIDHIVPRAILPKEYPNALPMEFHQKNRVACCGQCNNKKGHLRAECVCDRCREAWRLAREYLEPLVGWWEPPSISIEAITSRHDLVPVEAEDLADYPNWLEGA